MGPPPPRDAGASCFSFWGLLPATARPPPPRDARASFSSRRTRRSLLATPSSSRRTVLLPTHRHPPDGPHSFRRTFLATVVRTRGGRTEDEEDTKDAAAKERGR